jgi:hypothetical protein
MNWNSFSGFSIGGGLSKYIMLRNVRANHNGYGNGSAQGSYLRLENIETSYNNWRGDWGGFYGWDVAGIKMLDTHHAVIKGYRSVGNKCAGFWLDWNNSDIQIDNAFWAHNKGSGVFFEISQGPITMRDSVIAFNEKQASSRPTATTSRWNVAFYTATASASLKSAITSTAKCRNFAAAGNEYSRRNITR